MSTVKQLFEDAVKYEEPFLAHYIFCLLQEGKVKPDDDESVLDVGLSNEDKFWDMYQKNILGICDIKIFSLKKKDRHFVFIFAKTPEEARKLYIKTYKKQPLNCHELCPDQLMYYGKRFLSFREIKKEMQEFPCILGHYEKPDLTLNKAVK